jgi:hypothetical protein
MLQWTPDTLFLACILVSAINGVATRVYHGRACKIGALVSTAIVYGAMGGGLSMVSYDVLDGQHHPWLVLGSAMLTGIRAIRLTDVHELARKYLGLEQENVREKSHNENSQSGKPKG